MAISASIEIDRNNRRVLAQIKNAPNATERGIRNAFYLIGRDIRKEARRSIIKGPKTGKFRRVSGRKRRHRASAPGQPPANLTGKLQKSIGFLVSGSDEMEFGVRDRVNYGKFLELGTSRMAKREFLIRAIKKKQGVTENYFNGQLNEDLNRI